MIITEPLRGKTLMTYLNHLVSQNTTFFQICSILSDAIVFTFPLILILLTIIWWKKRKIILQEAAFIIFTSSTIAALINIIIQSFITKDRPESLPWLQLILDHLPTMSFPSDHAAVAMAFSVSFLLLLSGYSRNYKIIWIILCIGSIIMGICRTAVAVHWPTDIVVWWIIGATSAYLLNYIKESIYVKKILTIIVWLENKILDILFIRFK
jgi:membrane-associated phospholipid phosphatase